MTVAFRARVFRDIPVDEPSAPRGFPYAASEPERLLPMGAALASRP